MQTAGRAARNIDGTVILYADRVTNAIKNLQDETNRRRELQGKYNEDHGITPESIYKTVEEVLSTTSVADSKVAAVISEKHFDALSKMEKEELIDELTREMLAASDRLEFERAAELRDEIEMLSGKLKKRSSPYRYARRLR
jgi:excinuclease ABC subunit B